MATNFPASLDTLTNPTSSDSLSSPSHSAQHANVNDAVEALQAKVGADSSAVTSSLDYKVAQLEAMGTLTAFTPSWTNFTPGNATESWHYVVVNDILFFAGQTVTGSTSSVTGQIQFALPVGTQVSAGGVLCGTASFITTGPVVIYMGHCDLGSNTVRFEVKNSSSTYVQRNVIGPTTPFTWGSGHYIRAEGAVFIS